METVAPGDRPARVESLPSGKLPTLSALLSKYNSFAAACASPDESCAPCPTPSGDIMLNEFKEATASFSSVNCCSAMVVRRSRLRCCQCWRFAADFWRPRRDVLKFKKTRVIQDCDSSLRDVPRLFNGYILKSSGNVRSRQEARDSCRGEKKPRCSSPYCCFEMGENTARVDLTNEQLEQVDSLRMAIFSQTSYFQALLLRADHRLLLSFSSDP